MASIKTWHVSVEGMDYVVKAGRANPFKSFALTVNDRPMPLPNPFISMFTGTDAIIKLGNKEAHFVMIGNKMDLAMDGIYLDSRKPYHPLSKVPVWAWIFVAGYVPMLIMGGFISYFFALMGMIYTIRTTTSPEKTELNKVLLSLALEVGIWMMYIFIVFLFAWMIGTE